METTSTITIELEGCEKTQANRGITLLDLKKKLRIKEEPLTPVVGALFNSRIMGR
ncbi:unnamed protein product, partial [marine sediment metagenome]